MEIKMENSSLISDNQLKLFIEEINIIEEYQFLKSPLIL